MIHLSRKLEDGSYLITVRYAIRNVLTWSAKDRLDWELTDAACDAACQYLWDWRGEGREGWDSDLANDIEVLRVGDEYFFELAVSVRKEKKL